MNHRKYYSKYYDLLDYEYFECSIVNDPEHIGLGFVVGFTSFRGGKVDNFYIDLRFLTMTLEITIKELGKLKERVKRYTSKMVRFIESLRERGYNYEEK